MGVVLLFLSVPVLQIIALVAGTFLGNTGLFQVIGFGISFWMIYKYFDQLGRDK